MRTAIFSVTAALVVAAGFAPPAPGRIAAPHVRIAGTAPLTVIGTGYKPGTRVEVTASTGRARRTVSVRAGSAGGFRVRFSVLFAVEPCHGTLVITAKGADGETASVKRPCRPGDPQTP
jgi:hypothetical protein